MIVEGPMLDAARRGACPGCGAAGLIPGPRGGASQNVYCASCRQGWNLHGIFYGIVGLESIGRVSDDLIAMYEKKTLGKEEKNNAT